MTDKKINLFIIIVFLAICGILVLSITSDSPTNYVPASELTYGFNFGEADIIWDKNKKEILHTQKISIPLNKNYKDLTFKANFYKDDKFIGSKSVYVDKTVNSICDLNFTAKLPECPNEVLYEVMKATEV